MTKKELERIVTANELSIHGISKTDIANSHLECLARLEKLSIILQGQIRSCNVKYCKTCEKIKQALAELEE